MSREGAATHVVGVRSEAVVDARRQHNQIILLEPDPDPIVALAADVKVAGAVGNVANLLVLVQVLVEKTLDLVLVVGQRGRRHANLVAVPVLARLCDFVDALHRRARVVQHP